MYGLQAIERVNAKLMVWCEFAEGWERYTRTFTATGKRSRFYVCRFIDGTTLEH